MEITVDDLGGGVFRHTPSWGPRWYTSDDHIDLKAPSSTSIIDAGTPKPALLPWGTKLIGEKMVKEATERPDYLIARLTDPDDDPVKWVKDIPYTRRDKAGKLGTEIHEIVELMSLGEPYKHLVTNVNKPYVEQFQKFWDDFNPTLLQSEAVVLNPTEEYAGTLDSIMEIGGKKVLVDYKTGKNVYPETVLQCASYRFAELMLVGEKLVKMPEVDQVAVLHLRPDFYKFRPLKADKVAYESFLHFRDVFQWHNGLSKGTVGKAIKAKVKA